ncbi:hypothetical protein D1Y84_05340 [Acidipila sp. EB88]|nr:hypothetical protein D1Y84_05340 [Acidipila sp. EB88]
MHVRERWFALPCLRFVAAGKQTAWCIARVARAGSMLQSAGITPARFCDAKLLVRRARSWLLARAARIAPAAMCCSVELYGARLDWALSPGAVPCLLCGELPGRRRQASSRGDSAGLLQ